MPNLFDPFQMIRPRRTITGMSATLLPFNEGGQIDWVAFRQHLTRTATAGLIPAVNMDTGYVNLIDEATRQQVLAETRAELGNGPFVAGAFVSDSPDSQFAPDAYQREIDAVQRFGAIPVIFPSFGLNRLPEHDVVEAFHRMGRNCPRFIAFELGTQFAPFGRIYNLQTYEAIVQIPSCIGAKHSSLSRQLEWERIQIRNQIRPEFMVLTGNDLAIDMVMYGSDYLLGLSTFAPEEFAHRDRLWRNSDPRFFELNDLLQYLGFFAFREPVPGYKHNAAQCFHLRGWALSDRTHPASPTRPNSDRAILADIVDRLGRWCDLGV